MEVVGGVGVWDKGGFRESVMRESGWEGEGERGRWRGVGGEVRELMEEVKELKRSDW